MIKKFSHFLAEAKATAAPAKPAPNLDASGGNAVTYTAMLEKYGVDSVLDLSDDDFDKFHRELVESFSVNEEDGGGDIKDEKSFREYAEKILKKAHGDDYDAEKAKSVIDGLVDKAKEDDDWDGAVGRLQSSMG